nr:DUF4437 domain-containing protein [Nonlabens ulvanivorans]
MRKYILILLVFVITAFAEAQTPTTDDIKTINEVVTADNVEWGGWLNPLRGDKSPAAGKLWGETGPKTNQRVF